MTPINRKKNNKPKSQKNKPKHCPQQRNMDLQSSPPLFRLPPELRDQIYTTLFRAIRLTFGRWDYFWIRGYRRVKAAADCLAILRSCRQVYEETKDLWLRNVLFDFEHPIDLMNKLSALPRKTLSAIRHMRTVGRLVNMQQRNGQNRRCFLVPYVLKLLPPGLRLDSLTVLGDIDPETVYLTITSFIKYGHGWKELHFITYASVVLAFPAIHHGDGSCECEPQPQAWNEAILQRDGRDSGASVTIYRSTRLYSGSVLDPSTRQPFNQIVTSPETVRKQLDADGEWGKELLIVVRRGCNADISDVGQVQLNGCDLREWTKGMTWAQISKIYADFYDGPDEYQFGSFDDLELLHP